MLDADFETVVVDLQELDFMDSSGIALMVHLSEHPEASRLRVLPSKSEGVTRIASITGVDSMLTHENPTGWSGLLTPAEASGPGGLPSRFAKAA